MNKRDDIVQKFSTFLSFGDHKALWQADPSLERAMKRLVISDPEAKAEFWARYFLKLLRNLSQDRCEEFSEFTEVKRCTQAGSSRTLENSTLITARHLSAYLQEACLWAAQKSFFKYKYLRHKYPLEDYFQLASSFGNSPSKLLKSFNLDHPRSNLEGYAKTALFRLIRDQLYQQDLEIKREKFSDYGLLKNLNTKEFREALFSQGIPLPTIDLYQLAWQGFNEIHCFRQDMNHRTLEPPNSEKLKQIAQYYNQRLSQLELSGTVANEKTIQDILTTCIKAARNYRTQQFIPLEEYDTLCDVTPMPWDIAIQKEERQQVQLLVSKLFTTIPELGQMLLILWQGLNLTQSEIAIALKSQYPELQKQYQVARYLARTNKNILKLFVTEWNQANPNDLIQNEESLEMIKEALEECLQLHCQQWVSSILQTVINEMTETEKMLLFTSNNNLEECLKAKQTLIDTFIDYLETELSLVKDTLLSAHPKIAVWVEEWLICYKS